MATDLADPLGSVPPAPIPRPSHPFRSMPSPR